MASLRDDQTMTSGPFKAFLRSVLEPLRGMHVEVPQHTDSEDVAPQVRAGRAGWGAWDS